MKYLMLSLMMSGSAMASTYLCQSGTRQFTLQNNRTNLNYQTAVMEDLPGNCLIYAGTLTDSGAAHSSNEANEDLVLYTGVLKMKSVSASVPCVVPAGSAYAAEMLVTQSIFEGKESGSAYVKNGTSVSGKYTCGKISE